MATRSRAAACVVFLAALVPLALGAQTCVPNTTPDWTSTTSSTARIRPADCAVVAQTPPDFSWPDLSADAQYLVTLTYPDGHARSNSAMRNWINWDEILPAGDYGWQVQVTNASGTQQSRSLRFTVDASALPFVVPDWMTLFNRATSKAHPRAIPDVQTAQAMINQRQAGLQLLYSQVNSLLNSPVQSEPLLSSTKDVITTQALAETEHLLDAGVAWLATWNDAYYADALRRALNLASWDPHGSTAYANVDEVSRLIAGALALAYDWMYPRLDPNQRGVLLASILARGSDMYADIIGSRARVAIDPYDSHGNLTLLYLATICVLVAGDVPEAQNGLRDSLPLALNWTSPWGGEDSGFGNGSAYGTWTTGDSLIPWYVLRWTVGVDVAQKAWLRNWARFLAYFIPPGTPTGTFGDGAERQLSENWARFGKAYALFAPSPLARWYAAQLSGEDPSALELLLAPPADGAPAPYPAGTADAALFPSTGWAAMHSSLSDGARTSVYFKASPYGSFNHSHADQASFVVNSAGQSLAIDSGYYDSYGSPHWSQWYKQTRAHNAITYDGGQGQVVFENGGGLGPGTVTGFSTGPDHDIVQADATAAYGGALKDARRALVFLRPNLAVVYDRLASDVARQWEWNIHAVNPMGVASDQSVSIANGGQSLCVSLLAGPPVHFTQTSSFTADPANTLPSQWHGTFTSTAPVASTEFVALLDVGCSAPAASASKSAGTWTIAVGPRQITIDLNLAITVQ